MTTDGPPDFDALYRGNADPWQVATSPYEQRKLDVVLACLGRPRYAFAWDPACGTGHLAQRLAPRAERVLATDASPVSVDLTRRLCADQPGLEIAASALPAPPGTDAEPDLIFVSEVLYYLDDRDRRDTVAMIDRVAAATAEVLGVHWRGVPDDAWLGGAAAQQEIVSRLAQRGWSHRVHHDDEEFVIDTLTRGSTS